MANRLHVRVTGPLASYAGDFEQELADQGYRSAGDHLYVMAQLSRWLLESELEVAILSPTGLEEFENWRRAAGYASAVSSQRMSRVVEYLVSIGVVTSSEPAATRTPTAELIERYSCYLASERGLTAASVRVYVEVADAFLSSLAADGGLALEAVTTAEVTRFVLAESRRMKVASAKAMTTRLRSLLRFFYVEGLIHSALGDAVPSVASWRRLATKGPPPQNVVRLLQELRPSKIDRPPGLRRARACCRASGRVPGR